MLGSQVRPPLDIDEFNHERNLNELAIKTQKLEQALARLFNCLFFVKIFTFFDKLIFHQLPANAPTKKNDEIMNEQKEINDENSDKEKEEKNEDEKSDTYSTKDTETINSKDD